MRFEGPEKKLEIILNKPLSNLHDQYADLWKKAVNACNADIISHIKNDYMDAYLLSESSLFVRDNQIILITCGITKLLNALPVILEHINVDNIAYLFYERKRLMFPNSQQSDFEQDSEYLQKLIPGNSYRLGPANQDHMHLYQSVVNNLQGTKDITMEILMNDPGEQIMNRFKSSVADNTISCRKESGIKQLCYISGTPEKIDDHIFSPEGYSLNVLHKNSYMTIHVTPQENHSYVSYESNAINSDYGPTITQVLHVFKPKRGILFFTACQNLQFTYSVPEDYKIVESSKCQFEEGYNLYFILFSQKS